MRLSHPAHATDTGFDEPNLLAAGGLVPVLALADRAGLPALLSERLTVAGGRGPGHDGPGKVVSLVAGMAAGADSIDDMDLLRHGAMGTGGLVFEGVRAPSTLGTHLRAYRFGHVRQLDAVNSRFLLALGRVSGLLGALTAPGATTYVDVDDTIKEMHGYHQQGVAYGYNRAKGLNAQLATVSTPGMAPVIAAARLRKGNVASAHGAPKIVAEAVATAKAAGAPTIVVRADSAYYGAACVNAARKGGVHFSVTARSNPSVRAAIAGIDEDAWAPIRYPRAIWDEEDQRWVSDAQVAEVPYTAFTGRRKVDHVAARLIVRRVKRLNPASTGTGQHHQQGELFTTWRHHAVFTDAPGPMLEVEAAHRDHAIVEQVIADLKAGPIAHLPSGTFTANAAWLVCAVITHNLLRAAGHLAGGAFARARTTTVRARLVLTPARIVRSARRVRLRLPTRWPWAEHFTRVATAAGFAGTGPPVAVAS